MARGTAFSELVSRTRSETLRSDNLAIGPADLHIVKEKVNSTYQTLYMARDWAHLKTTFTRVPLSAGDRYYNCPTGLNSERVISARVWWNDKPTPIDRGIGFDEYNTYSSEDDERSDPVLKWDVKWTGSADQIEVWPIPSTNDQSLQFIGIYAAPRLVNDADLCLLDDDLVVLFAAAALLGDGKNQTILGQAQDHFRILGARGKGGEQVHQMGLGSSQRTGAQPVVLRIGHTN